ncbi:MAG: GDP-mannose 4,6-dehydratase [Pseudomonadaceae bacterium]|nr:GDP-mannose 4,6-dehydratase [Pseudomonadaceae bacterium]
MTIFITGVAGFIGFSLAKRLLGEGKQVVGIDNLNDYYDPTLKQARLDELAKLGGNFAFHKTDLADASSLTALMLSTKPSVVLHVGAQASVRYGLTNQVAYLNSNLIGHFNILAACKALQEQEGCLAHLLYASSSSVYGGNAKPGEDTKAFCETDNVMEPQSLYAATKLADEAMTEAWCHQFKGSKGWFPASGLRFFTVYGPWGRPDMSPVLFASAMLDGRAIPLFNGGDLWRDFTYIDDIVEAVVRLMDTPPARGHEVYNLGNQNPVRMDEFVQVLGNVLGKQPLVDAKPWPPTEVYKTFADTRKLHAAIGWAPATPLQDGLQRFADWYVAWHGKFKV